MCTQYPFLVFFQGKKKKEKGFKKLGYPKLKLFHVSKWLRYFKVSQQNFFLTSHWNYSTTSSNNNSLYCSFPLDGLPCDTRLFLISETVLQKICRWKRRKRINNIWTAMFGQPKPTWTFAQLKMQAETIEMTIYAF